MKYSRYLIVNEGLSLDDITHLLRSVIKKDLKDKLSVGIKLSSVTTSSGYNNDDFVRNTKTILIRFDKTYKIPRIVGKHLLNKLKTFQL
jgi:hypothetical protein